MQERFTTEQGAKRQLLKHQSLAVPAEGTVIEAFLKGKKKNVFALKYET